MKPVLTNPIIPGFYPDPSICRVGDDFYLVWASPCFTAGISCTGNSSAMS